MKTNTESFPKLRSKILCAALIFSAIAFIYFNTLGYPFQFDDNMGILENPSIRNLGGIRAVWEHYTPRFVTYLTFALNYRLNGLSPAGYRLVNIIIHALTSISLFSLILGTSKTPALAGKAKQGEVMPAALLGALIFAVHPVQTQAVTYIYQRLASMAALFYISSLLFYAKSALPGGRARVFYVLSAVMFLLAMFTKENVATLPAAILLYDVFFIRTDRKTLFKRMIPFAGILSAGLYFIFFSGTVPEIANLEASMGGMPSPNPPALHYLFTQFRVAARYLRLVFLPLGQNLDYDYPLYDSLFTAPVLLSFFLHGAILSFAIFLFKRKIMASFGIFLFYTALLPESSIIPVGAIELELIFEHRLYLPLAGLCMAAAELLLSSRKRTRDLAIVAFIAALTTLSFTAYARNTVWRSEYNLWKDTAEKSPEKPRVLVNYGKALVEAGRFEDGRIYLQKALDKAPHNVNALNNLGLTMLDLGRNEEARSYLGMALEISPRSPKVLTNMGLVYFEEGDYEKAVFFYEKSLGYDPGSPFTLYNMGNVYEKTGEFEKAEFYYTKAIDAEKFHIMAYNNRGVMRARAGRDRDAMEDFTSAIRIDPRYAPAYLNRGAAYARLGEQEKALKDFISARELGLEF